MAQVGARASAFPLFPDEPRHLRVLATYFLVRPFLIHGSKIHDRMQIHDSVVLGSQEHIH